jgi:hypothetical protein
MTGQQYDIGPLASIDPGGGTLPGSSAGTIQLNSGGKYR